ncbi:MAG: acyl-CoA thioesterase [Verrucomicrobia bacterium]|nr:acyl-CoA thioesterase [Verrucomicrobiota bacterium]
MAYEFKLQRRVEFSETDAAGIVHFSNFFRYMESAEHAFFRSLGFSVMLKDYDPPLGFPRVHVECDYRAPLRFEDLFEIHLLVREKKPKALSYLFKFRNLSTASSLEAARGGLTVVCVAHHPDGRLVSAKIPHPIAEQIHVAPPELLG